MANSVSIRDSSTSPLGNFTLYNIEVNYGGRKWVVERRYNDFVDLDIALMTRANHAIVPRLPPKSTFRQFCPLTADSFMHERQKCLGNYLDGALRADPDLSLPEMRWFLGHAEEHLKITASQEVLRSKDKASEDEAEMLTEEEDASIATRVALTLVYMEVAQKMVAKDAEPEDLSQIPKCRLPEVTSSRRKFSRSTAERSQNRLGLLLDARLLFAALCLCFLLVGADICLQGCGFLGYGFLSPATSVHQEPISSVTEDQPLDLDSESITRFTCNATGFSAFSLSSEAAVLYDEPPLPSPAQTSSESEPHVLAVSQEAVRNLQRKMKDGHKESMRDIQLKLTDAKTQP